MTTPRLDAARALEAALSDALEPIGARATLVATEVGSSARDGVALVQPPELTFPAASDDADAEWPVHLIAGPARDYLQAWATIDQMLSTLTSAGFPILKASPAAFQPQAGEQLPAYTITITG